MSPRPFPEQEKRARPGVGAKPAGPLAAACLPRPASSEAWPGATAQSKRRPEKLPARGAPPRPARLRPVAGKSHRLLTDAGRSRSGSLCGIGSRGALLHTPCAHGPRVSCISDEPSRKRNFEVEKIERGSGKKKERAP